MSLLEAMTKYLESKGWYFDWDHVNNIWDDVYSRKELDKLGLRMLRGWTVPQWGEYWTEPYADDPNHKNYGSPRTRRYEDLKGALWSQLMREEEPEQFEGFFRDITESAA